MNIWNKEKFGDIDNNINKLEAKIAALVEKHESKDLDEVDVARQLALQSQLRLWYKRKELYWRQMSRENSIKFRDKNTKFYHALALGRRTRNRVHMLRVGGRDVKGPRAVKCIVRRFFK